MIRTPIRRPMIRLFQLAASYHRWRLLREEGAAQIVEFAVSLPLLIVFVVGIFDFSSAFTLKQRLTNIARDAARAAAIDPANDLTQPITPIPVSVMDAFQIVDNYLIANNMNDCAISNTSTPTGLTWVFTASANGCLPPGLTITVNRAYYYPATGAATPTVSCTSQVPGGQMAVISTCVSIQYAYPWRFGKVAGLLGSNTVLPQQLSAIAVALNEN
jgi:Flp pilus assembly protein TadG